MGNTPRNSLKKNSKCRSRSRSAAPACISRSRAYWRTVLEEAVPALAGELAVNHHEGFTDQPRQQIEHVGLVDAVASTHLLSSLQRPHGWEHDSGLPSIVRGSLAARPARLRTC